MGARLSEESLMSRLPAADIAGVRGVGVVPGGERSHGMVRAEELASSGGNIVIPTHRPLAGAQTNNRGNSRVVTLGTNLGSNEQRIASVVETSKDCGPDAEVITVQLGLELPPQLSLTGAYGNTNLAITALLEWGVGNAFFEAEVDWERGTSFSVCASWLRVSARVGAVLAAAVPDLDMVLKASLAYGDTQNVNMSSSARRTLAVVPEVAGADQPLNAGATSAVIAIPMWAQGFTLVDCGEVIAGVPQGGAPDYTVMLSSDFAQTINFTTYRVTSRANLGNQIEGQFPIPRKRRFISVRNNLGVQVDSPTLIFNLGF